METITFDKDIKIMYITASSFPDGVLAAHQKLHSLIPFSTDRKYFGISRPENGDAIVYKAAAEELESGEAEKLNCETMVLKKGNYLSITINDYMRDISAMGKTFGLLTSQPGIDPQGYCVELYISDKDLKCMIRLKN
jgi:hypothetical protein